MENQPGASEQSIQFLNGLLDYSHIPNLQFTADKFDLQRVRDLLALMGDPQSAYRIIHLAGTKGKGSTAAMLAAILQAAGYRVGLFTSPYLFDLCEQIRVDGVNIPQTELAKQVEALKPYLQRVQGITSFEALTAICFQYFKDQNIDFAVVEAGLGGLTDATNVVDPLLSVITSISYDHTGVLGNSIAEIATHKAGIIKKGRPVVVAPQAFGETEIPIREAAEKMGSDVFRVQKTAKYYAISYSLEGQSFRVEFTGAEDELSGAYDLPLLGRHQIDNAATALCAARVLTSLGVHISRENAASGLLSVNWPCRFEVVRRDPLIVLDGAHNVDSTQKLRQTIQDYLEQRRILMVFGASVDKDLKGMLEVLLPGVERVIFCKSAHPRAAEPAKLVELGQGWPVPQEICEDVSTAVARAISLAEKNTAIIITGSLFTAAAARLAILKKP